MKRILAILTTLSLMLGMASCASVSKSDKIQIVTTIFPIYDWVRNIVGDNSQDIELTLLMNSGTDLHSFQPTAQDIVKISNCDMFIYVGGESDEWVDDCLKDAVNKEMVTVNLMEGINDRLVEEDEFELEEENAENGEDKEIELDEHIWLSLRNASACCDLIEQGIAKIDSSNKATYETNLNTYKSKLDELDQQYTEAVNNAEKDTVLFADRFPFRYMVEDYGLNYFAAFSGCSAESEASFETVIFLAGKIDELGLTAVFKIESSDDSIPESVIDVTATKDQSIIMLDSMQSVTSADIDAGVTYVNIMENNLEALKAGL